MRYFYLMLFSVIIGLFINTQLDKVSTTQNYYLRSTGFFIDDQGHFITAAHGVPAGYRIAIKLGQSYVAAHIIYKDESKDFALLGIDAPTLSYFMLQDTIIKNEVGTVIGFPADTNKLTKRNGPMHNIGWFTENVEVKTRTCGGNSGGPLVNKHNEVVGVIIERSSYPGDKGECGVYGYAIDIQYIITLYRKLGLQLPTHAQGNLDYAVFEVYSY